MPLHDQDEYLAQRNELIAKDQARRLSSKHTPNEAELRAERVIRTLRQREIEHLWTPPRDLSDPEEEVRGLFPGMGFLTAKKRIKASKLLAILKKMPKGGLLHAHFDATVDIRELMTIARGQSNIYIRITKPFPPDIAAIASANSLDLPLANFTTLRTDKVDNTMAVSLTSPKYALGTWVQMNTARELFPKELGGVLGFDDWLYRSLTIDPVEAYETHSSVSRIWAKFETTFDVCDVRSELTYLDVLNKLDIQGLIRNERIFQEYTKRSLLAAINDGISYIEYRMLFFAKTMFTAEGEESLEHKDWLRIFQEAVEDVRQQLRAENREDAFVGAKIIYTTLRHISPDELKWYMDDCLALKADFPDLITGFDIVGAEDRGHPLLYFVEAFNWFKERQKALGLEVPLILHAGETLGDGDATDGNLYDAILLGTKRIGHGFSMTKHPHLMELCKEKDITLEVCPISNEVLRLTTTMPMHPLLVYLAHGVPVTINCDDPAIWGSVGVSYDYYQILISSDSCNLSTLADLSCRGLTASCLAASEKEAALNTWRKKWAQFVEEVASIDMDAMQNES